MKNYRLIQYTGVIQEHKPFTWRQKRAYDRKIDRALRYVCPEVSLMGILENAFWLIIGLVGFGSAILFPVMVVRWLLCL